MTEEPRSLTLQRKTIPSYVESAVTVALAKLPADRFASAHEFGEALQGRGGTATRSAPMARPAPTVGWRARLSDPLVLVPSLVAVAALAGVLVLANRRAPRASGIVRFSVELTKTDHLNPEPLLTLSPDGRQLVVPGVRDGKNRLFVRRVDRMDFTAIPGTEGATRPFFSPDERWIGFSLLSASKLMKVPAEGGAAVAMADASWGGGAWGPDGTIVYTPSYKGGLWRLPAGNGKAEAVTTPDTSKGELAHWWPQFLPDGRHVLFTNFSTPIERAKIEVVDLKTGARKVLVEGGVFGRYVSTGHLLYARGETILALHFDPASLTTSGSAVAVVEDVAMQPSNGMAGYAVSAGGTLAYVPASTFVSETQPVWVDRSGGVRPLLSRPGRYYYPRLSPDGRRVALSVWQPAQNSDVWIYETARDILTRLTSGAAADFNPLWTPDGRQVIYTSERPVFELYRRAADASTAEEPLLASPYDKYAGSISPDGKLLAFSVSGLATQEIWLLPLDGSAKAKPFLQNGFNLARPAFSPDGHWLAYDSDESGGRDVYIQSFPDPARARRQVSIGGGADAHWTQGGRELTYRHGDSVLAVAVNPVSGETSRPTMLLVGAYAAPEFAANSYDVTADGRRFLMIKQPPELAPRQVNVVLNWLDELKRKTGAAP